MTPIERSLAFEEVAKSYGERYAKCYIEGAVDNELFNEVNQWLSDLQAGGAIIGGFVKEYGIHMYLQIGIIPIGSNDIFFYTTEWDGDEIIHGYCAGQKFFHQK